MHWKTRLTAAAVVVIMTAAVMYGGMVERIDREEAESIARQRESLHFWYADEALSYFVNSAAASFEEETGVSVITLLVSDHEYLEAIYEASLDSGRAPDAYIISHDFLEKAYLAGLASRIEDEEKICTLEHFPQTALSAATCRGSLVGYPLFFDTSILVCNETLLEEWAGIKGVEVQEGTPRTVEDMVQLADAIGRLGEPEGVWKWDVEDIFYNYWFVGSCLSAGGEEGDDPDQVDIFNPGTVQCLEIYQTLNQIFPIESDHVDYDLVMEEFCQGRLAFTIASGDVVQVLERAKEEGEVDFAYSLARLPWLSEDIRSRALSVTGVVAVNGYSKQKSLANCFAAYLVQECAGELYSRSGRISPNLDADGENTMLQILKEEYEDSMPLPKMMALGDFWIQLENLFSKVWNGGDAGELTKELAEEVRGRITAYYSSHGTQ